MTPFTYVNDQDPLVKEENQDLKETLGLFDWKEKPTMTFWLRVRDDDILKPDMMMWLTERKMQSASDIYSWIRLRSFAQDLTKYVFLEYFHHKLEVRIQE